MVFDSEAPVAGGSLEGPDSVRHVGRVTPR